MKSIADGPLSRETCGCPKLKFCGFYYYFALQLLCSGQVGFCSDSSTGGVAVHRNRSSGVSCGGGQTVLNSEQYSLLLNSEMSG